jgi:putative ABC transport system ATP-binding protein
MVNASNLTYTYSSKVEFRYPDFRIAERDHLLVTGPSGSGKTTLLNLVAGFLPVQSGSLVINGTEMVGLSARKRDLVRKNNMGIVPQRPRAVQALTLMENMMLVSQLTGTEQTRQEASASLERLGIGKHADRKPEVLSVGEQQRLAIAMASAHRPPIILADEPTSSLDDANASIVVQLLVDQATQIGGALMVISHDQRLVEHFSNRLML